MSANDPISVLQELDSTTTKKKVYAAEALSKLPKLHQAISVQTSDNLNLVAKSSGLRKALMVECLLYGITAEDAKAAYAKNKDAVFAVRPDLVPKGKPTKAGLKLTRETRKQITAKLRQMSIEELTAFLEGTKK